jgi:hypothetical protein
MSKLKKQKDHQVLPAVTGIMQCEGQHRFWVRDLNTERKECPCPVCGGMVNIGKGLTQKERI